MDFLLSFFPLERRMMKQDSKGKEFINTTATPKDQPKMTSSSLYKTSLLFSNALHVAAIVKSDILSMKALVEEENSIHLT